MVPAGMKIVSPARTWSDWVCWTMVPSRKAVWRVSKVVPGFIPAIRVAFSAASMTCQASVLPKLPGPSSATACSSSGWTCSESHSAQSSSLTSRGKRVPVLAQAREPSNASRCSMASSPKVFRQKARQQFCRPHRPPRPRQWEHAPGAAARLPQM